MPWTYRARCVHVVDGDTFDLEVDLGFHLTALLRFRLNGVDTPELNDRDEARRAVAVSAREQVLNCLSSLAKIERPDLDYPLEVKTYKAGSFGRWVADVSFPREGGWKDLGDHLVSVGLAVRKAY